MPLIMQGPFECRMTVQNFVKIVRTVFEKIEIFMKRSGEKKQHYCISSRKFFPTPKKRYDWISSVIFFRLLKLFQDPPKRFS